METTGIYRDYRVYIGDYIGKMEIKWKLQGFTGIIGYILGLYIIGEGPQ